MEEIERKESFESSSNCQSGWTMYLGNIFSCNPNKEEEGDLSMVSDASSGPPQVGLDDPEEKPPFFSMVQKKREDKEDKEVERLASPSSMSVHCYGRLNVEKDDYPRRRKNGTYLEDSSINHLCVFSSPSSPSSSTRITNGKRKRSSQDLHEFLLDDTASSTLQDVSKIDGNVNKKMRNPHGECDLEFSSCFSVTHLEGEREI